MLKRIILYVIEHVLKRNCDMLLYVSFRVKNKVMCALRINYSYHDKKKLVHHKRKNS